MYLGSIGIEDTYKFKAKENITFTWGNNSIVFPEGKIFYGSKPLGSEIKTTPDGTAPSRYMTGQVWLNVPLDKVENLGLTTSVPGTKTFPNTQNRDILTAPTTNEGKKEPVSTENKNESIETKTETGGKNKFLYIAGAAVLLFLILKK